MDEAHGEARLPIRALTCHAEDAWSWLIGFWLPWLGLNECWWAAYLSGRTGRDFLSHPNTTVSQSSSHLSRQRLVNCNEKQSHTSGAQAVSRKRLGFIRKRALFVFLTNTDMICCTETRLTSSREALCSVGEKICRPRDAMFDLLCHQDLQDLHSPHLLCFQTQQAHRSHCCNWT